VLVHYTSGLRDTAVAVAISGSKMSGPCASVGIDGRTIIRYVIKKANQKE
jgi:hypothetical protein